MLINNFRFLVLGPGRGGTSLLAGLLDQHSQLEVGFEKCSINCLMRHKVSIEGHRIFDERVKTFLSCCHKEARRFPDKIWGDKITTEQLYGLEDHNKANPEEKIDILDQFFNKYLSEIKVVFILRDGRTCINSKVARTGISAANACERWKYAVKVYKFFKNSHHNNITIKFEELLINPEDTLNRICMFLGITYQEKMLMGTNNPKIIPEYRQTKFDLTKLELRDIPPECMYKIAEDLKYCNYITDSD